MNDFNNTLQGSEEIFKSIAEQPLVGICIIQNNLIKYANQRYAEISGYSVLEMKNWKPGEFLKTVHPEDRDMVMIQSEKKQAGQKGIINHYQFRALSKSGEIIWIEILSNTIMFQGKSAVLIMIIEITEKKEMELYLSESEHRLKERVKELKCLYGFSKIIEEEDITKEERLRRMVELLPPAWQFPDIA